MFLLFQTLLFIFILEACCIDGLAAAPQQSSSKSDHVLYCCWVSLAHEIRRVRYI